MTKQQSKKLAEALVRAVEGAKQPDKEVRMTFDTAEEFRQAQASLKVVLSREELLAYDVGHTIELTNGSCIELKLRKR